MKSKFKDRWEISWKTFWNSASQPCHDCMRQHWVGSQVKWVLRWNSNWNPCYCPLQCGPALVSAAIGRRRNKLLIFFFFSTYITVFLLNSGKGFETRNDRNRVPASLSIFHLYSKMLVMHFSSMNVKGIGIVKEEEV